jgi:hypothetical protein
MQSQFDTVILMLEVLLMSADDLIKGPKLLPYHWWWKCPSCGMDGGLRRYWVKLWMGAHSPFLSYDFCAGNKPLSEVVSGSLEEDGVVSFAIGPDGPRLPKKEVTFQCAGIAEPHLHVSCKSCGLGWLSRVSDGDQQLHDLIVRRKEKRKRRKGHPGG